MTQHQRAPMKDDPAPEVAEAAVRHRLRGWFESRPGQWVLEEEAAALRGVLADLFGYHLLQVERLDGVDLLQGCRVLNTATMGAGPEPEGLTSSYFCGVPTALPVMSDSIDVVVLPHVLEFEAEPHQALREAERVLVPEGHLVITGFNPWSLLGLRRLLPGSRDVPWSGSFISHGRLKDWLALLGLDVVSSASRFFRPPLRHAGAMERLRFMDRLGERLWGMGGGVYVVVARKRVIALTPIRPRWRRGHGLLPTGLAEPTPRQAARVSHHG